MSIFYKANDWPPDSISKTLRLTSEEGSFAAQEERKILNDFLADLAPEIKSPLTLVIVEVEVIVKVTVAEPRERLKSGEG